MKINFPLTLNNQATIFVRPITILLLCLLAFSPSLFAQKHNEVLILNSDASINKYVHTQEAFQKTQAQAFTVVDLTSQPLEKTAQLIQQQKYTLIYCIGTKAYQLAHRTISNNNAINNKKIVFSSALNGQRLPLTNQSYGIAQELPTSMQLTMYRYLFPEIKKIGLLYSKNFNQNWFSNARELAKDVGIELIGKEVSQQLTPLTQLTNLLPEVDALWLIADPLVLLNKSTVINIFNQTEKYNKPIFTYNKTFINLGALLVISADIPTIGQQVSALIHDLLNNTAVEEKFIYPAGSHVILNMKKLNGFSLELNKQALDSVNQIIE